MNIIKETEFFDKDFLWSINKVDNPIICLSLDHKIVFVNNKSERLFDVSRKSVVKKSLETLFKNHNLEIKLPKNIKNNNSVKITSKKSKSPLSKSHKIAQLNWEIKEKISCDGNIVGYIVFAEEKTSIEYLSNIYKEVTGQRNIDNLSVAEYAEGIRDYYEGIIAYMPGNVYWMDKDGIYLGCNDNTAKFIGLSDRKDIFGRTYEDTEKSGIFPKGQTVSWHKDDMEVIKTGKPKLNVEEPPVKMLNGKIIYYLTSRAPIFDNKKNVIGIVGVSIDITDRKKMQKELEDTKLRAKEAEKKLVGKLHEEITGQKNLQKDKSPLEYAESIRNYYESIIACMPGNVYWVDKDGISLGCNDNTAKFTGLSHRKEIIGRKYTDDEKSGVFLKGQTDSWHRDNMEVIKTGKSKLNVEEPPVKMPDGSTIYYLTNRVPLFDDDKNVIGVVGISIDITDRKRAQKLKKKKELAEKTAGIMEMLGGSIAHELRTPLATIKTYLQLLEKTAHPKFFINNTDREDIKKRIGIFEQCTRVIDYVIKAATKVSSNILIKLRSLATGTIERRNFKKSSIRKDIQEAVKTYPYQESEKGKVHVVKGEDFYYYGDPSMTEHVLYNIIKNALRAIQEAKKGDITIKVVLGNEYHKLVITDTAIGVSKAMCKKMFEKFTTITENNKGTGLGLAFCRMVMQSYGGDIVCNSKKGEFTQFVLTFPVLKFIGHRLANPRTLEKKLKASFREF